MKYSNIRFPTTIKFGLGTLGLVPEELKNSGKKRPLVVTDKGMVKLDIFQKLLSLLRSANFEFAVFSDTEGNPVYSEVTKGVVSFKEHNADSVIAIGGGCAVDVAKAISLMAHHEGDLFDYEDGLEGAREITDKIPWTLAIPTTAGTGSEVGGSSVISDDKTKRKVIIWSSYLVPSIVIADPELLFGLPKGITAATGIDALTHNIEAFLAKGVHPFADGIALEGIRLVHKSLVTCYQKPENKEARADLLAASMMGATAFQKGLGVTHSCAHALSACFDLHHGLANGLMLIPCMEFNLETSFESFARMGHVISVEGSSEDKALGFIKWLSDLKSELGLSYGLKEASVSITDDLVSKALSDPCHLSNPRACTKEDFKKLFEQAY